MGAIAYSEPYRLPAGILALAVHVVFLLLLYFGVSWQVQPPQGMVVDIWSSLPAPQLAPAKVEPPPVPQAEPPKPAAPAKPVERVQPALPPKADIELAEKKKLRAKPVEAKKPPVIEKKLEAKKPIEVKKPVEARKPEAPQPSAAEQTAQNAQAEQARARAAEAAAIGKVLDEHKARIVAKIRRNIVMPPDVPNSARTEFGVTLLPGGSLLSVKLVKSSGNAAYDSAVERAIYKSEPLPLPPDVALFNKFRELHLKFSPVE